MEAGGEYANRKLSINYKYFISSCKGRRIVSSSMGAKYKYELQQLLSVIDSIQYKGRVQKRTVD